MRNKQTQKLYRKVTIQVGSKLKCSMILSNYYRDRKNNAFDLSARNIFLSEMEDIGVFLVVEQEGHLNFHFRKQISLADTEF